MMGVMALGTRPLMFQEEGGREGGRERGREGSSKMNKQLFPGRREGRREGGQDTMEGGEGCGRRSRRVAL
jgi:hypothetical protein